jgi:hypothetical protein
MVVHEPLVKNGTIASLDLNVKAPVLMKNTS